MPLALMLPGRAYTPVMPLLAFARLALEEHGYLVRDVEWDGEAPADPDAMTAWVRRHAEAGPVPDLVVGKSRGSLAAGWAADHGAPALWLTPLLVDEEVVGGIRANPAPQLLVGGLADPFWDAAVAAALREHGCAVHEIAGADHALADLTSAVRSAEMQLEVARATDAFLASLA